MGKWGYCLSRVPKELLNVVNRYVYMVNVNIRVPTSELDMIDQWVEEGRFASRSDAIRMIVAFYEEREKTRGFYQMLEGRSREARENPEKLVALEEL